MSTKHRFATFLVPSVFQATLSLLILPVTTRILGPEDYGIFALLNSITALGLGLGGVVGTYLLSSFYPLASAAQRAELVSSLLYVGIIVSAAFGAGLLFTWQYAASTWPFLLSVPTSALYWAIAAMVISVPWTIAYVVIILDGAALNFAITTITASIVSAITVIVGLYYFHLGLLSLFLAAFAGSLVMFGGAVKVLLKYLRLRMDRKWLTSILKLGTLAIPANILELVQTTVERSLLLAFGGFQQVGLYSHAQQYKNMTFAATKAVSNSSWPVTLEEARMPDPRFYKTGRIWKAVYVFISILVILFATLGPEIIGAITNGKFKNAGDYAAILILILLVQFSGKPQLGMLYARGQASFLSMLTLVAMAAALPLTIVLIPKWGVPGAMIGITCQMVIFRVGIHLRANALHKTPFQDQWAIKGIVIAAFVICWNEVLHPELILRATVFVLVGSTMIFLERKTALAFFRTNKRP